MRLTILLILLSIIGAKAQDLKKSITDSIYIHEVEQEKPAKILHAEPLYIDLIRDLGARKGEKEWNVGFGLTDRNVYDEYEALIEYEWAPANRLGLEIELPFSIYPSGQNGNTPSSKLNSLKIAGQYSFFVSEKFNTSMAFGYIHEIELTGFENYGKEKLFTGNIYNPFYIVAKRWGSNFHSLMYTGPQFTHHFSDGAIDTNWQINTNFHYMISGTRNFIGVEFNKNVGKDYFDMTIRPQMRLGVMDNLLIGIVTGIPISRENERFSTFLRLIYEPGHKH
ncbi:phosphoribosylformylglycinamidine synthase [Robertkochia marina]|uniref:Phosphoribosylformylglycinamidine synthase n=1 Tax=Robertkochia marina TaxID=1227945 RepID=A0A4S3LYN5_9FLAO|nr:HAEPLYID family protein [Robertkochia marina]THD66709.1 phosphoribosylformylglycinamidine synthase [Robertkochia marina]TRZ40806.1 phosphoribosylformylglycinamidine synthase [Robertkochia marina]